MKLREIAHSRTGDKGPIVNISVIARHERDYERLSRVVTADRVKRHLLEFSSEEVVRYELPQIGALNFVIRRRPLLRHPDERPHLCHPGESRDPAPCLWLLVCFARTASRPCAFSLAILASESLSLACPRESNQREGHPRYRGRRLQPATSRGRCGGSLTAHPCADSERARLLRAPLRAFPSASSPRHRGTPERRRARPSWPQKQ